MSLVIDYYFAPQSPWTYLGHERLASMAAAVGARISVRPIDLGGKVFPVSGGLPLGQRPAQRRAYRLLELRRFSEYLRIPLNLEPKFFPVAGDDAARLIIAVDQQDGPAAAMTLTGAVLKAVWAQERNIADEVELAALLAESALPFARLAESRSPDVQARYDAHTQEAIGAGVFGAPTYVVDGEMFWGQDRLDFLERRLAS